MNLKPIFPNQYQIWMQKLEKEAICAKTNKTKSGIEINLHKNK